MLIFWLKGIYRSCFCYSRSPIMSAVLFDRRALCLHCLVHPSSLSILLDENIAHGQNTNGDKKRKQIYILKKNYKKDVQMMS